MHCIYQTELGPIVLVHEVPILYSFSLFMDSGLIMSLYGRRICVHWLRYLLEQQQERKLLGFMASHLYLHSLSRLSTSNQSPYKWCFSCSHLIVAGLCAVDETQSDNNTQFQLNSFMCDLYLRNCFLHQSDVMKTTSLCLHLCKHNMGVTGNCVLPQIAGCSHALTIEYIFFIALCCG